MATRGRPSTKDAAKALGPDRVPENQKREVYERVRRAVDAKGGCTNHLVGSSAWDKQEQKVLEDGLRYYPHERHSNMLIYIRIAASLPKKTVRDVAHHLRHMQDVHRAKLDAAGMNSAKRHHPDPAAAAAMAAMHEHQMAAMFAANTAGGIAAMHTLPGLAQGLAGPGGPGPHLKDHKVEARVCALLQENMAMISSIRENMVMGRFFDNHSLMLTFDKNVKEVTALLATLPFAEMQKLPVQINPYFITGSLPGVGQQLPQQVSPTHHHHAQPVSNNVSNAVSHPPGCGVGNSQGNGNGVTAANAAASAFASAAAAAAAAAAAQPSVAVGAQQQQPRPPPPPQQQQQQSFAAAPPVITPAAQAVQPTQLVPDASSVVDAVKAAASAASAAAAVIAATPVGGKTDVQAETAPSCPPPMATPESVAPPAVEVPVTAESRGDVGKGVTGEGGEKVAEGVMVAPPGA